MTTAKWLADDVVQLASDPPALALYGELGECLAAGFELVGLRRECSDKFAALAHLAADEPWTGGGNEDLEVGGTPRAPPPRWERTTSAAIAMPPARGPA
jgi:hypothetical protein